MCQLCQLSNKKNFFQSLYAGFLNEFFWTNVYLILSNIGYFFLGTDDEAQEYDYLGAWGPRFDKLADMYGPGEETEQEEE